HERLVLEVGVDNPAHGGLDVRARGAWWKLPPRAGPRDDLAHDVLRQRLKEVALVLEVDIERGPGDLRLGDEPFDADLGEALAVGEELLDSDQQAPADLPASGRSAGLGLARDRGHSLFVPYVMSGQSVQSTCLG